MRSLRVPGEDLAVLVDRDQPVFHSGDIVNASLVLVTVMPCALGSASVKNADFTCIARVEDSVLAEGSYSADVFADFDVEGFGVVVDVDQTQMLLIGRRDCGLVDRRYPQYLGRF